MISVVGLLSSMIAMVAAFLLAYLVLRSLKTRARLSRSLDVQMLQVLLPKDIEKEEREEGIGEPIKERIGVAEQFLSTLSVLPTSFMDRLIYGAPSIIFEIIARPHGGIFFYAGTHRKYIDHLEKQIYAHYPEAEVTVASEYTIFSLHDTVRVASLTLRRKQYLPIATYKDLEVDPMQALTGALAKIQSTDAALIQYVLQPASRKEARRAARAAATAEIGAARSAYPGEFPRAGRALGRLLDARTHHCLQQGAREARRGADLRIAGRAEVEGPLVRALFQQPLHNGLFLEHSKLFFEALAVVIQHKILDPFFHCIEVFVLFS